MTTVLGVDAAFGCTGCGVWRDGQIRTFSIRTNPKHIRVRREAHVLSELLPWVNRLDRTLAMVEGVYQGRGAFGRTSLDLAGLHDVIVHEFYRNGVRVGVVNPVTLKMFATGKGSAGKGHMVTAAEETLGVKTANDNEADALWLSMMGVYWMGGAGAPATSFRADAVEKIDWIVPER